MTNIVTMPGVNRESITGEPSEMVIAICRDLLEMAEDGRLQSMVGTGFLADGSRIGIWADAHTNVYEMLGAINWLEHEYVERHTE